MQLNIKAFALTLAFLWGIAVLLVGLANLAWPGYGEAFLRVVASVYPGYEITGSLGQVIVGTLYALVDGLVAGMVFAWLYNTLTGR